MKLTAVASVLASLQCSHFVQAGWKDRTSSQMSLKPDEASEGSKGATFRIQARAEQKVYPTEVNLSVVFSATDNNTDLAREKVNQAMEKVLFTDVQVNFKESKSTIVACGRNSVRVEKENARQDYGWDGEPEVIQNNVTSKYTASSTYLININPLNDLEDFAASLVILENVSIRDVEWVVSDEVKAEARRSLRRQVLQHCHTSANTYAESWEAVIPGASPVNLRLQSIEEQWVQDQFEDQYFDSWRERHGERSILEVSARKIFLEASCEFAM